MPGMIPPLVIEMRFRFTWMCVVYLRTLGFLCALFGCEPDWDKVLYWSWRLSVIEMRIPGGRWERIRPRWSLVSSPPVRS